MFYYQPMWIGKVNANSYIYEKVRFFDYTLANVESGLFVIKGETVEEFLRNGADHAIQKHGMNAEDIYLNNIPTNLLCHSFNEGLKD